LLTSNKSTIVHKIFVMVIIPKHLGRREVRMYLL